jgi:peptidoglycan/LPS O-acetylase OafA/YrhL
MSRPYKIEYGGYMISSNGSRLQRLDVLRGVAVLLVLGRHILYIPEGLPVSVTLLFNIWREVGWVGVDLFFVLSGFLVSGLLFSEYKRTGELKIFRFLVRRGFKIYPSFYLFLAVTLITSSLYSLPSKFEVMRVVGETTFLQNYIGAFWHHTWSLSVEEHFYFLLCLAFVVMKSGRKGDPNPFLSLPRAFLIVGTFLLVLRILVAFGNPPGTWRCTLGFSHFRIDSLFFGVVISYWYRFFPEWLSAQVNRYAPFLSAASVGVFLVPILFRLDQGYFMYTAGFTLLYLGFGALLVRVLFVTVNRSGMFARAVAPLTLLGRYSYSIYLWHLLVYFIIDRSPYAPETAERFYTATALYLVGSLVVGIVTARLVEFPALRVRDRFYPSM